LQFTCPRSSQQQQQHHAIVVRFNVVTTVPIGSSSR
jgi:hypothetical protein